ncbi:MAG: ATP-binding protein [Prolixibacteraceae bacterium]
MGKYTISRKHNYDFWQKTVVLVCALVTMLLGLQGLLEWFFGFNNIHSLGNKFIPMDEESAILFLITAVALAFIHKKNKNRLWRSYLTGSAIVIGVYAILMIVDHETDYVWNLSDKIGPVDIFKDGLVVGRTSVLAALCFFFLSISLLLLLLKGEKYSSIFSSTVFLIGYTVFVGYSYGVPFLYDVNTIPMSWPTSIAIMFCSMGFLIAVGKENYPVRYFVGLSTRARMMRSLMPLIFLIMISENYFEVYNNKYFNSITAFYSGIVDIFSLLIAGLVISFLSRSIGNSIDSNMAERKRIEEELRKAKEQAEESDRLKSAFLANMSHEIRTPMNGILGFAELLKLPDLNGDEQKQYISIIEKSGARMLNIINDIIDISKIESGLMKINLKKSNINDQIDYIYTFFKPEVEKKGMHLSIQKKLPSKIAIIITDREKLFAILTNLVKNAIKYSEQGSIEFGYELIETDNRASKLKFFVKDTGIGIPLARQKAIFERFVQADIADLKSRQGAGLGLSISKAFVEMLGGEIWVESLPGKGSIFYFTLPYNIEEPEIVDNEQNSLVKNATDQSKLRKILVVEDDEISSQFLVEIAGKFSNEVLIATSGLKAVEISRKTKDLDLILLDIGLPDLDGYEVAKQIRQFNKNVIIIAQTAYGLSSDRSKALASGCNDYISKPINRNELLSLVDKHCFGSV